MIMSPACGLNIFCHPQLTLWATVIIVGFADYLMTTSNSTPWFASIRS